MELWDGYYADGTSADVVLKRDEPIPEGLYHLVCQVLVRHADGEYLLMQRAWNKNMFPGYYEATAGGSALQGEDAFACVKRELYEETGIAATEFTEIDSVAIDETSSLYHVFLCVTDCAKDSIVLQEGETISYKWISEDDYIDFINSEDKSIKYEKIRYRKYLETMGYLR